MLNLNYLNKFSVPKLDIILMIVPLEMQSWYDKGKIGNNLNKSNRRSAHDVSNTSIANNLLKSDGRSAKALHKV